MLTVGIEIEKLEKGQEGYISFDDLTFDKNGRIFVSSSATTKSKGQVLVSFPRFSKSLRLESEQRYPYKKQSSMQPGDIAMSALIVNKLGIFYRILQGIHYARINDIIGDTLWINSQNLVQSGKTWSVSFNAEVQDTEMPGFVRIKPFKTGFQVSIPENSGWMNLQLGK